jgi:hypothetical protein
MFWKTTATTLPNILEVMKWYDDKNGGVDYDGQVIIERW